MSPCCSSALFLVDEEEEKEGFTVWVVLTCASVWCSDNCSRSFLYLRFSVCSSLFLRLLFSLAVAIVDGRQFHSTCLCTCGRLVHCSII